MAMSQAGLEARMIAELEAKGFNLDNSGWMTDFLHAISKAVYDEITINARATGTDAGGHSNNLNIV